MKKFNLGIVALGLALVALSMTANAFPLSGGNGKCSATVYGVLTNPGSGFSIDMSFFRGVYVGDPVHANDATTDPTYQLIDSDDKAYEGFVGLGGASKYNGSVRETVDFKVPDGTIIKRLKITPVDSDPFSIDWNGVPEVDGNGIAMRFYGITLQSSRASSTLVCDIKVTNTDKTNTLTLGDGITADNFMLKDTNGWVYSTSIYPAQKLLPNESLRLPIRFGSVGLFSRPAEISFKGVSMDIGAWT